MTLSNSELDIGCNLSQQWGLFYSKQATKFAIQNQEIQEKYATFHSPLGILIFIL